MRREPEPGRPRAQPRRRPNGNGAAKAQARGRRRRPAGKAVSGTTASPGQTGIWGGESGDRDDSRIPAAVPSTVPTSATFARGAHRRRDWPRRPRSSRIRRDRSAALDDVTDAGDSPPTKRADRVLAARRSRLLEDVAAPIEPGGSDAAHARNEEIIVRKLASFEIDGQDRRPQRRPGRDPVRGPARGRRQGQPDRGPRRRPGDGARRPDPPDRGADPGQERGRHRDPEPGLQRRRPARDPRGGRLQRDRARS